MIVLDLRAEKVQTHLAIVSGSGLEKEADLLTAEFSKKKDIVLLERDQIQKILMEANLVVGELTEVNVVQMGRLLGADGLILLKKSRLHGEEKLILSLVAVDPGIVLEDSVYPLPTTDFGEYVREISSLLPKLQVQAEDAICISVVGLFSTLNSPEAHTLEQEITTLLIHRLSHEPSLFVLERRNMEKLLFEKELDNEHSSELRLGSYLLEGSLDLEKQKVVIYVQLKPPKNGKAKSFEVKCDQTNLSETINTLTQEILNELHQEISPIPWEPNKEAEMFFQHAKWALQQNLLVESAAAAESAWALGHHEVPTAELRIRAYSLLTCPGPTDLTFSSFNPFKGDLIEARIDPSRLDAALRMMELYNEYQRKEFIYQNNRYYDWRVLGERVLLAGSRLLRVYWENEDESYPEKREELREWLRRIADDLIQKSGEHPFGKGVWTVKAAYAPFWYKNTQETLMAYRDLLKKQKWAKSIRIFLILRDQHFRTQKSKRGLSSGRAPWLLLNPNDSWREFIQNLKFSNDLQTQIDGWSLAFHSAGEVKTEKEEERKKIGSAACDFLWRERDGLFKSKSSQFVTSELYPVVPFGSKTFRLEFLGWLLTKAEKIDPTLLEYFFWGKDFTETELKQILKECDQFRDRANMSGTLSAEELKTFKAAICYAIRDHLKLVEEWDSTGQHSKHSILKVKNFHPLPQHAGLLGYQSGKLWYVDNYIYASNQRVCAVDPISGYEEFFAIPDELTPIGATATTQYGVPLVSERYIVVAYPRFIKVYNRKTKKWQAFPIPLSIYEAQFVGEKLYFLFRNIWNEGASGILSMDLRDGQIETLVSTRRRPVLNSLDNKNAFTPCCLWDGGRLGLRTLFSLGATDHQVYNQKPSQKDWQSSVSIKGYQFNYKLEKDGLLILRPSNYNAGGRFDEVLWIGRDQTQLEILLKNPSLTEKEATVGQPKWEFPSDLVGFDPEASIIAAAAYDKDLWLLTARKPSVRLARDYSLYWFKADEKKASEFSIEFELPSEQTQRLETKDQEEVWNQESHPVFLSSNYFVKIPEGFIITGWSTRGFWTILQDELTMSLKNK